MTIRVLTLPDPRVITHAGELEALTRKRQLLALFLYLAIERTATRDTVLAMFWPDRNEERARHALSQCLYELRQLLKHEWVATRGDKLAVAADVQTDLSEFEAAVRDRRFEAALGLYAGNFLEGVHLVSAPGFQSWLDLRRAQTARLHRRVCREVLAACIEAKDANAALAIATRWAEREPLDDEAQQRVIESLARLGRRTEAIHEFERFEERLRREELEPLPELSALVSALRAGTYSASPPPIPADASSTGVQLAGLPPDLDVVRLLGEGNSARVYLAREPALGRLVAVKVLSPRSLGQSVEVRRFEREARAAARIQHPNVTPVFRVGALRDGARYLVISYVDGGSLEDRLAAVGIFSMTEARRAIGHIAAGLAAAHRLGIVHRDVRPANVLYDRAADRFLITDFGLAALVDTGDPLDAPLTRPGEKIGAPAYASPEQLRGEPVTERADIFSLGVVAFELLTGQLPFAGTPPAQIAAQQLHSNPPSVRSLRTDVDPALDQLIGQCLQKRPEQRPFASEVINLMLTSQPVP